MARPKAFDPSEVLLKAIRLFWSKGYAATSMEDLVLAMGINRASLYNAFGNKRSLYMQALESYWLNMLQPPVQSFSESGDMLSVLTEFQETAGCFLLGCMSELSSQDPEVLTFVEHCFARMREMLVAGVIREREKGLWSQVQNDDEAASLLLTCLVGMRLLGKGGMAVQGHAGMALLQRVFARPE